MSYCSYYMFTLLLLFIVKVSSEVSHFNCSECGVTKGCYFPDKQCEESGISYKLLNNSFLELELFATPFNNVDYIAVAFSKDPVMGNDPVIECSSIANRPFSMKFSYNEPKPRNVRITGTDTISSSYFYNTEILLNQGALYCHSIIRVTGWVQSDQVFKYVPGEKYYLHLAIGKTNRFGLNKHDYRRASSSAVDISVSDVLGGMDDGYRIRLVRAHGILMIISWLCFIPSAMMFARFLRHSWPLVRPAGVPIWFHIHRGASLCGTVTMCASFICILCANNWNWTGVGSSSGKWAQVHTMTGLLALLLAWIQPFISTMRCSPKNPNRPIFNWVHRVIGSIAFLLATISMSIAADRFTILSKYSGINLAFSLAPMVLLIVLAIFFPLLDKLEAADESRYSTLEFVRQLIVLISFGFIVADAIVLSVMIA